MDCNISLEYHWDDDLYSFVYLLTDSTSTPYRHNDNEDQAEGIELNNIYTNNQISVKREGEEEVNTVRYIRDNYEISTEITN